MMRITLLVVIGFLAACEVIPTQINTPINTGTNTGTNTGGATPSSGTNTGQIPPGARQAMNAFDRVAGDIYPIARSMCRQRNPNQPARYCNFRIGVDTSDKSGPNAYQTIGQDGRPIIAFNQAMLATIQNEDEIAFILGHEAGHQIASHLVKSRTNTQLGATLLGTIISANGGSAQQVEEAANLGGFLGQRVYSKDHELQADVIGTYIAHQAGYDALRGAQSFRRFSGGGGFLSTHPASPQRLSTVEKTMARIRAGQPLRLN